MHSNLASSQCIIKKRKKHVTPLAVLKFIQDAKTMYGCMGSAVGMVRTILVRASSVNANASKLCVRQNLAKTPCKNFVPHSTLLTLFFYYSAGGKDKCRTGGCTSFIHAYGTQQSHRAPTSSMLAVWAKHPWHGKNAFFN